MAVNECVPYFRIGDKDVTGNATATIVGGTFVATSGDIQASVNLNNSITGGNYRVATAGAGLKVFGVAGFNATTNQKLPIIRHGNIVPMIADGNITAGDLIEVGTAGKPKLQSSGVIVGKATTTAASGAEVGIEIL